MSDNRRKLVRNMTVLYLTGLLVLGALSTAAFVGLQVLLNDSADIATIINKAGKQRTLSQRIALLANKLVHDPADRASLAGLVASVDEFENSHHTLARGDIHDRLPDSLRDEMAKLYFTGAPDVDALVTEYVAVARKIAQHSASGDTNALQRDVGILNLASQPLLQRLDQVMGAQEALSNEQIQQLHRAEITVWTLHIIALMCIARFVFEPMTGRVDEAMRKVEETSLELSAKALQAEMSAEEAEIARNQLDQALDAMNDGFALWDTSDRMIMCNDALRKLYPEAADMLYPGVRYEKFLEAAITRGSLQISEAAMAEFIRDEMTEHRSGNSVREFSASNGRFVRLSKSLTECGRVVAVWSDITEIKQAEKTIRKLAMTDPLTGLANRTLFQNRLGDAIAWAKRSNTHVAVLLLDLDHFKPVNDTWGHPTGDRLLKVLSERLVKCVREVDTVARLGGDEFAIVLSGVTGREFVSGVARRIIDAVTGPVEIEGTSLRVGTSVGISLFPGDAETPDELIRTADMALYNVKDHGRGDMHFYDEALDRDARQRREIEGDLRKAIENNEFELFFQPQVETISRRLVGAEGLLRWNHPEKGLLTPDKFLGVAEASDLMVDIGAHVMQMACAAAASWSRAGLDGLKVAINLSGREFAHPGLVEMVAEALADHEVSPKTLEIEITEAMMMDVTDDLIARMSVLESAGVRLAIDDFGTGYSSLTWLSRFPVRKIKIDRSFVSHVREGSENAAITEAVIRLGHSLNLTLVAEGVECDDDVSFLRKRGCDVMQGYHISKPMPADAFIRWAGEAMAAGKAAGAETPADSSDENALPGAVAEISTA